MPSSNTYAFNPAASSLVLAAFARIQLRPPQLTTQHLMDAQMESNLLMVDFSNRNPNGWALETVSQALTQGIASYDLPGRTVAISMAYISTTTAGSTTDRVLGALSAYEYAAQPNKMLQGFPTSYWFNNQINPAIVVWPVPDGAGPYTLNMQIFRQQQDVVLSNGTTIDTPYRFIDAFVAGLAARLAQIYKPEMAAMLDAKFEKVFNQAAATDQEDVNIYFIPGLGGYYR